MSVAPAIAADNPITYFHSLCANLPRLLREGGSAEEVKASTSGLMQSLLAFHAEARGAAFYFDLYPARWGFSGTIEPGAGPDFTIQAMRPSDTEGTAVEVQPAFERDGEVGLLLLPAGEGWRYWHPSHGPCAVPDSGRLRFGVLISNRDEATATFCEFREKWGDDLPFPLYAVTMATDPTTDAQRARLVGVLRGLAQRGASGGAA